MDLSRKVIAGLQSCWGPVLQKQVTNIIAYGSGAMPQTHDSNAFNNNTLDLMIEVRSSDIFHQQLMSVCPQDYAGAASFFGHKYLKWTDQAIFPMHSNHINLKGKKIKYSIVSLPKFRQDLHQWNCLSFAGRLHKPILAIMPLREGLDADIACNREAATAIVLLMLGKRAMNLSKLQLFSAICQLSYMGDIRFTVAAQNPNKVSNIVNHNYNLFQKDYLPILNKFSEKLPSSLHLQQNGISFLYTPQSLVFLLSFIPKNIFEKLVEFYPGERSLVDRILLSGGYQLSKDLKGIIRGINRRSSFWMAAQNLITGSPLNNMQYLLAKLNKKSK